MMTEQNRDAHDYINSAVNACRRRLALLTDAHQRGIHTDTEYENLRSAIIAEQEEAWDIDLQECV